MTNNLQLVTILRQRMVKDEARKYHIKINLYCMKKFIDFQ